MPPPPLPLLRPVLDYIGRDREAQSARYSADDRPPDGPKSGVIGGQASDGSNDDGAAQRAEVPFARWSGRRLRDERGGVFFGEKHLLILSG